jgi:hypothetical protein
LCFSFQSRLLFCWFIYHDKKVVGVFVRFSCAASLIVHALDAANGRLKHVTTTSLARRGFYKFHSKLLHTMESVVATDILSTLGVWINSCCFRRIIRVNNATTCNDDRSIESNFNGNGYFFGTWILPFVLVGVQTEVSYLSDPEIYTI